MAERDKAGSTMINAAFALAAPRSAHEWRQQRMGAEAKPKSSRAWKSQERFKPSAAFPLTIAGGRETRHARPQAPLCRGLETAESLGERKQRCKSLALSCPLDYLHRALRPLPRTV